MKGILPCPKCNGEVEVVRLKNDKVGNPQYRIQCMKCGNTVGRGTKFPEESLKDGLERIKQYEKYLERYYATK